jgi:hypothetical protein
MGRFFIHFMGCTRVDERNKIGNDVYYITFELHSNISYMSLVYIVLTVISYALHHIHTKYCIIFFQ